jgi:hypothetical protein
MNVNVLKNINALSFEIYMSLVVFLFGDFQTSFFLPQIMDFGGFLKTKHM